MTATEVNDLNRGADYWLRFSAELWAERDSLRLPDGVTLGEPLWPTAAAGSVVLVKVHDDNADRATYQGTEVEWTVRLRIDDVVELVDRRVVGVRGV